MAIQQSQVLPAQFVQDLGQDLAKQVTAQSGVPTVSVGLAGISQRPGEATADFKRDNRLLENLKLDNKV